MSEKLITSNDIRDWRAKLRKTQAQFANLPEVSRVMSFGSLAKYELDIGINSKSAQAKLRLVLSNITPLLMEGFGQ